MCATSGSTIAALLELLEPGERGVVVDVGKRQDASERHQVAADGGGRNAGGAAVIDDLGNPLLVDLVEETAAQERLKLLERHGVAPRRRRSYLVRDVALGPCGKHVVVPHPVPGMKDLRLQRLDIRRDGCASKLDIACS
jgi:hypothetical protein